MNYQNSPQPLLFQVTSGCETEIFMSIKVGGRKREQILVKILDTTIWDILPLFSLYLKGNYVFSGGNNCGFCLRRSLYLHKACVARQDKVPDKLGKGINIRDG